MSIFAKFSGLDKLVQKYPGHAPSTGSKFEKQTIKIGSVRYSKCLTTLFNSSRLYLKVTAPFRKVQGIYIPWKEVVHIEEAHLYCKKATKFIIGAPEVGTISVYESLFLQFKYFWKP